MADAHDVPMSDLEARVAVLETVVASLRARQNDQRGDLARIGDAVADVRVVQAEHSAALSDVRVVQAEHSAALTQLSAEVAALTGGFDSVSGILNDHGRLLATILDRLPDE